MQNSIAKFLDTGIKKLMKAAEDFAIHPEELAEFIMNIGNETNRLALDLIGETLSSRDSMLRESIKRKAVWSIIKRDPKEMITSIGTVKYEKTLFINKKTGERRYLLDDILGLDSHERISEDALAKMFEEAAQTSYEKAGIETCSNNDRVSRQTVKNHLHGLKFPEPESSAEKKVVEYLYIDADEDHISLQFQDRKGDLEPDVRGYKNNCVLGKLVYVYEGIEKEAPKSNRHRLVGRHYFSGVYEEKMNARLWEEIERYLQGHYDLEKVKRIYLNADGGGWIKGGKSRINGLVTVLDEFHLSQYLLKMTGHMLDDAEEARKELKRLIKCGTKDRFREYLKTLVAYGETESAQKRIQESGEYILNNWMAARIRLTKHEEIKGCSAEGHVSHVLSARMSSRPMGWCRKGADKMCHLRAYYLNGGNMLELVRYQKKELPAAAGMEQDRILSAKDVLHSEKNRNGELGKYVDAMRATLSLNTREKLYFRSHIIL